LALIFSLKAFKRDDSHHASMYAPERRKSA
jgi:hypothetical protein